MKTILSVIAINLFLIINLSGQNEPRFYLDDNGVTIKCENCSPGDKGIVNGVEYTAIDRDTIYYILGNGGDLTKVCTSLLTDMSKLLFYYTEFNQDISSWDVSNVTDMSLMFNYCKAFNQDISAWDVSKVTNMFGMFSKNISFNQNISNWDVSNVKDMSSMFYNNLVFNQNLSSWDVSHVKNMKSMFQGALVFDQDLSSWKVDSVENMQSMFQKAISFNGDIRNWNVGSVRNTEAMFKEAATFNQDISAWDVSSVINMNSMFQDAPMFNQRIDKWIVSHYLQTVESTFNGATSFSQDLSAWCTKYVYTHTNFALNSGLKPEQIPIWGYCWDYQPNNFRIAENNQTIICDNPQEGYYTFINDTIVRVLDRVLLEKWFTQNRDISKVCTSLITDMSELFMSMEVQDDISCWDVSNVTNMEAMFSGSTNFNHNLSLWDVSKVTNMKATFQNATSFNQDISTWDVSNVTNMEAMFDGAKYFNQNIGSWAMNKVRNTKAMFRNASAFNQDISSWNVALVKNMDEMFLNANSINVDLSEWDVHYIVDRPSYFSTNNNIIEPIWGLWSDNFYLDSNGITIKCFVGLQAGNKGYIDGVLYEAVNNSRLRSYMGSNDVNLNTLCTSLVSDLSHLFENNQTFNDDISNWDVSNVRNMDSTFYGATSFNQDLGIWCVQNVESHSDFNTNSSLEIDNTPIWEECLTFAPEKFKIAQNNKTIIGDNIDIGDYTYFNDKRTVAVDRELLEKMASEGRNIENVCTSLITDMSSLFSKSQFNQDISSWDVSNVTDMSNMFSNNNAFNQEISYWDVSNVTNMDSMFLASKFYKDISSWCVQNIPITPIDFMTNSYLRANEDYVPNWGVDCTTGNVTFLNNNDDLILYRTNGNGVIINSNTTIVRYTIYDSIGRVIASKAVNDDYIQLKTNNASFNILKLEFINGEVKTIKF